MKYLNEIMKSDTFKNLTLEQQKALVLEEIKLDLKNKLNIKGDNLTINNMISLYFNQTKDVNYLSELLSMLIQSMNIIQESEIEVKKYDELLTIKGSKNDSEAVMVNVMGRTATYTFNREGKITKIEMGKYLKVEETLKEMINMFENRFLTQIDYQRTFKVRR